MMIALIGDIGNTNTKICLVETKNFKVKKIINFHSEKINSSVFLKKKFKRIIKGNHINKFSLFSSVVPRYFLNLKKFFKKNYKIKIKEIKEKSINKLVKIYKVIRLKMKLWMKIFIGLAFGILTGLALGEKAVY